jgi:uncharacterized repeat protein (TIGR02543 family)
MNTGIPIKKIKILYIVEMILAVICFSGCAQYINSLSEASYSSLSSAVQLSTEKYTITYVLNGGTNNSGNPSGRYKYQTVTFEDPVRTGYVFGGWYRDSLFVTKITAISSDFDANITVYAEWLQKKNITITNAQDEDINIQNSIDGSTVTLTTESGYDSYRWFFDDTELSGTTDSVTISDITTGYHVVTVTVTNSSGKHYSATCYIQKTE